jgi:hypothetical protein
VSESYILYRTQVANRRVEVGSILCGTMRGALLKVIEVRTNGGLLAETYGEFLHGHITPAVKPRRTALIQPHSDSAKIYSVPSADGEYKGGVYHCCYRHVTLVPVSEVTCTCLNDGSTIINRKIL